MKKAIVIIASLISVVIVAVLIYIFIPKYEEKELSITAEVIKLEVGETKDIVYSVNIQEAFIQFEVEDSAIAKIEDGAKIKAVATGETKLKVIASFKEQRKEVSVDVIVSEKVSDPIVPPEPSTPEGVENEPDKDEEEGSENLPEEEGKEISLQFTNLKNIAYDGEKFSLAVSTNAYFSVTSEENLEIDDVISLSGELTVSKYSLLGNNTYKIHASSAGTYSFKIIANSAEITFVVEVF